MCWQTGTAFAVTGSLPDNLMIREKPHVGKIYHGRLGRDRVACDGSVSANPDGNHRPRQHGAGGDRIPSFHGDWRASKLVGLNVYNDNNESIGSINDLLTDKSGNIKAVVIGVGGFLGVGAHLVAVPFDKIKFVNEPVAYTGAANGPNAPSTPAAFDHDDGCGRSHGAVGDGEHREANPWYPDHAVFNATKDQLKAMPEFKYSTE